MSCLGPYYSPIPAREWSRVQNQCTDLIGPPPTTINVPLLGTTVPFELLYYQLALINKGNVLQYKKNSSNLTKNQRYSQIAKGQWTNRNTTWATQSDKYSNPNTLSLKRVNGDNITLNGTTTFLPVTCPTVPTNIINILPPIIINPVINPDPIIVPPLPNPNPEPSIIPVVPDEVAPTPIVIQNLGSLLCNVTENICTGETVVQPSSRKFHPTTDSDVPGTIRELYWDERLPTWYPRQRYTMNNSTDKWPINSKAILPTDGFRLPLDSTVPYPPILDQVIPGNESVTLIWEPTSDGGSVITEYIITVIPQ